MKQCILTLTFSLSSVSLYDTDSEESTASSIVVLKGVQRGWFCFHCNFSKKEIPWGMTEYRVTLANRWGYIIQ